MVRFLLDRGAEVNEVTNGDVDDLRECDNGPALHKLLQSVQYKKDEQYLDVVALLCERGADPMIRDELERTAFDLAEKSPVESKNTLLALLERCVKKT